MSQTALSSSLRLRLALKLLGALLVAGTLSGCTGTEETAPALRLTSTGRGPWLGGITSATGLGSLTDRGVDRRLAWVAQGPTGAVASLATDMSVSSPTTASVNGTWARLELDTMFYTPTTMRLVGADGVVTADGTLHEVDALVLATGFDPRGSYAHLDITGRDGRSFAEEWQNGVESYLGVTMADFPNLFMLLGPNTGLGHTSVVLMIEAQIAHVMTLLDERDRRGAHAVEVRPELVPAFTREMRERSGRSVWTQGGCTSWYLDDDGENRTLWPGGVGEYEQRLTRPDAIDFLFT